MKVCSIDNLCRLCYYVCMVKKQIDASQFTPVKTSALDRFALSFEYNKTLQEIKKEVRIRTI